MRNKSIEPEQIIIATIHLVAQNSLENLTTRKVAAECGVSDGYLFNYFENKTDLLTKSFFHIDNEIDAELKKVHINVLAPKKTIHELWMTYFNFLVENGDYAKYYRQFRHSSYYTPQAIEGQNESYKNFITVIAKGNGLFNIEMDIFWVFVIETTLNFAVRVYDKQLPCSEKDKEKYFAMLAYGMNGIIKNTKEWNSNK